MVFMRSSSDLDGSVIPYDSGVEVYRAREPAQSGDLGFYKKIDILGIYIFGSAFASSPSHRRWDSKADADGSKRRLLWMG